MKREYDFPKGVRGKFFRKEAALHFPVYLDAKVHRQLERIAKKKHTEVGDLVNQLLKKDVELLEAFS
jgi:cytidylate kinase